MKRFLALCLLLLLCLIPPCARAAGTVTDTLTVKVGYFGMEMTSVFHDVLRAAAVCLVVTTLRKRWYNGYMADPETLSDCVCERETKR